MDEASRQRETGKCKTGATSLHISHPHTQRRSGRKRIAMKTKTRRLVTSGRSFKTVGGVEGQDKGDLATYVILKHEGAPVKRALWNDVDPKAQETRQAKGKRRKECNSKGQAVQGRPREHKHLQLRAKGRWAGACRHRGC